MYAAHLYILKAISPVPDRRSQRGDLCRKVSEEGRRTSATDAADSEAISRWHAWPSILPPWNLKIFRSLSSARVPPV
jgi:hypothetical protein